MSKNLARISLALILAALPVSSAEQHGLVTFGGVPVPGATVTATGGGKKISTITDDQGNYAFPDLSEGAWTIEVDMSCFEPSKREVTIAPPGPSGAPPQDFELKLLPIDQIQASILAPAAPAPNLQIASTAPPQTKSDAKNKQEQPAPKPPSPEPNPDPNQDASDNFVVNGSQNNGAASPFAQSAAFGNNRRNLRGLYNGSLGVIIDNSALDAEPFSLTGQNTLRPSYNNLTGVATFGGPIRIPHLISNGPFIFVAYQWKRNDTANTTPGLVPTAAERMGDFSALTTPIIDPTTGAPFAGNVIPSTRLSSQALALLNLYPLPNFTGSTRYNYQIPTPSSTHSDAMQLRSNKLINNKNQISGLFAFQDSRANTPNLFNFIDTTDTLGINANIAWRHTLSPRLFSTLTITWSRQSTTVKPFWENRENISGDAGITGNNQQPINWGPPTLTFADGTTPLTDGNASVQHNQTGAVGESVFWSHGRNNITFGGDLRRQEFNTIAQQNPRGTLTFTGQATGDALADFLLGIPDAAAVAYGNADKYFRSWMDDAFFQDDWRLSPELTLNLGVRWEYGSPITELYGRLVNLDIAPGFSAVAPVVANDPVGSLTGTHYPASLVNPDKTAIEPRIALAWRPISGSSLVVRSGYGIYYNTSVYQQLATQMAQQAPLSTSLSVANSAADPLTLANPFKTSPTITPDTFAIDPNFRVGYVHQWNLSVQRDLPGGLVMLATYLGIKGTRGEQEFLPNTYALGAANPCPTCPSGFTYVASNGNSERESGSFQLRRRLHAGFTATLQYTYSKSIDDAILGGAGSQFSGGQATPFVAQNWLDLDAERALSTFDQRHLLNVTLQYTTGMGLHGGTLVSGWRGALLKEWTFYSTVMAGTGLPLTPVYLNPTPGTGVTGNLRPEYTGANLYAAPSGLSLNPAAYAAPPPGEFGNAGRDSITGPSQFTFNASMARTFRLTDRLNLDLRVDSTNVLNHVTYTAWDTTFGNAQFGLPVAANAMRSMLTTLRLRF